MYVLWRGREGGKGEGKGRKGREGGHLRLLTKIIFNMNIKAAEREENRREQNGDVVQLYMYVCIVSE